MDVFLQCQKKHTIQINAQSVHRTSGRETEFLLPLSCPS